RVKDLRHIVVADVFGVALLFLMAQAVVIAATAWAEDPQSGTACSFEVKPEFTPLSEISSYYIAALIAADDPNFYNRTPEQTARVYEFFKTIEARTIKALQNPNMREEDARALKDILDSEKFKRPDLSVISRYISSCDGLQPKAFYARKLDEAASV